MNPTAVLDGNRNFRIGENLRIYRNDGTNRSYEAICTHIEPGGIALRTQAVFTVGEVVEFTFADSAWRGKDRHPARVMYRTLDRYGLGLLNSGIRNRKPASLATEDDDRLQTARQLLFELKTSYDVLPAAHREAVREVIAQEVTDPGVAA
jgi:hypothetical protein